MPYRHLHVLPLVAVYPLHPPPHPQVRIHSTTDTDFYLRARSKPIIEHSCRVRFAPFALLEPGLRPEGAAAEAGPSAPSHAAAAAVAASTTVAASTAAAADAASTTATVAATAAAGEALLLLGADPADGARRDAHLQLLLRRHKLGEETGMYQQASKTNLGV